MEELFKVLERIKPGVDFRNNTSLIDDEILDSFDIVTLVAELDEEFDVQITAKDILPENFNSAEAMYKLIEKLEEE